MTKPIIPSEVTKAEPSKPAFVYEAFNSLIQKEWDRKRATFRQDAVVDLIRGLAGEPTPSRDYVFDNHWLDVEEDYRKAGWVVKYDSPAYCESYPSTFTFSKKERH